MVDDLSDFNAELVDLKRRITRLESGSILEASSIDRGGMTVRAAEGIRVEAPGTIMVGGDEPVTLGQFGGQAQIAVGTEGLIFGEGGYLVVRYADHNVLSANASTTSIDGPGEAGVVVSSNAVRVDGPGDIEVNVASGGIQLVGPGGSRVSIEGGSVGIVVDGNTAIAFYDSGHILVNRGLIPQLPSGMTGEYLVLGSDNRLYRTQGGSGGGPGGSRFQWPFSLDLVTSEFRPPDRPSHEGIDFGLGIANIEGTPIPCMGSGTVSRILAEGQGHGWGNGVVVDHGTVLGNNLRTLYAHMYQPPAVSLGQQVGKGQTLGGIGNTGNSFGNHLHLETHVNGVPINPRDFMATYQNA
jgi:hypothetical protein